MLTNYYTLQALVEEWHPDFAGAVVADVFSQAKDELSIALAAAAEEWTLRVSVRGPLHFLFRAEGISKARRNVATLFEEASGRALTGLRIAERDRIVYLDLEGDVAIQILLFGPRANVLLVDERGMILEAFQNDALLAGERAPQPTPAPLVTTFEDFEQRWRVDRKTTEQAISAALPLFDRTLAAETMHRAGVPTPRPPDCTEVDRRRLFEAGRSLMAELEHPVPRIYWNGPTAEAFSLVPLHADEHLEVETFESVNAAVAVFVRRTLAQEHFRQAYEPLDRALTAAVEHYRRSAETMLDELAKESRADRYERWGHLLMASAAAQPAGQQEITLPDLFADDAPVTIPLDPALNVVDNAQQYYDRARRTRQARTHAEQRLLETEQAAQAAAALLEQLHRVTTVQELDAFKKEHAAQLERFAGSEAADVDRVPFRRYRLDGGYEVWVGRNAQQNDLLTFRYAQKHDLWMHARGVPGSHAVLRLPSRQARPGRPLLERAASIAAYHSKAQGSGLVPVMVTERKYVRKPKGAPPGAVVVERENVLIVEPRLPGP